MPVLRRILDCYLWLAELGDDVEKFERKSALNKKLIKEKKRKGNMRYILLMQLCCSAEPAGENRLQ